MKTKEERKGPEVIVAFSLGGRKREPGISNEDIAKSIWERHQESGLPMICQWEVGEALIRFLGQKPKDLWLVEEKGYLPAKRVARLAVEIMRKQGWVVAEPWAFKGMLKRAAIDLEWHGVRVVFPKEPPRVRYDPKSKHWWTRNWFYWILRDAPVKLAYKIDFLYKWILG